MPDLIRHYIRNVLIGFAIAALFVTGLLVFDVMGLWHLVSTSPQGWIAVLMLFVANGIVFAGVQFAVSILLMAEDEDDGGPRGGHSIRRSDALAVPVPVRSGVARRTRS